MHVMHVTGGNLHALDPQDPASSRDRRAHTKHQTTHNTSTSQPTDNSKPHLQQQEQAASASHTAAQHTAMDGSTLHASAAPFVPASALWASAAGSTPQDERITVFTVELGMSCGASVTASDYSAPSSPRCSVAGSLAAEDRDLETHLARTTPQPVCPELRKLGKKLAQVAQLKVRQAAGAELDEHQLAKVAQEADFLARKSVLERQAELAVKQARANEALGSAPVVPAKRIAVSQRRRRGSRAPARSAPRPALSADRRALPRTQRFSLRTLAERTAADAVTAAATGEANALEQLDRKIAAARAAEDARQGWCIAAAKRK
jgi:hypothetical protein